MDLPNIPLDKLIDAAPDATVIVSATGEIIYANAQVESLFDYHADELVGEQVEKLLPERYRAVHPNHRKTFFANAKTRLMGAGLELYGLRKDGTEFPVEISLSSVQTKQGTFISSAIRDITSRIQLSEQRFRAIFQQKHQLAGIVDLNGILVDANETSLSLAGLKHEGVIGKPFWETGWWSHDPQMQAKLRDAIESAAGGETIHFEATHPRPDGRLATVDFSIRPVRNERSDIIFLVAESQDISERKQAELALQRSYEQLEDRVAQRTKELARTNEQLRDAKEIAEAATTTKTRFLAAASHDLRQPLQSIRLYLSVLNRHPDQPKADEIVNKIHSSLEVMGELLDALLDISKLNSGSIQPIKKDFAVQQLIDKLVAGNEPHALEKGLTLRHSATPCVVHSDPALLQRIVENFVSNAILYTEKGHIEISCEAMGDVAQISVRDTGVGIPAHALDSIFDEYYQLDNDVRDRRKGLGLGLAIVKQISKLLNHQLDVQSTVNGGSTFRVEIPLGQAIVDTAEPEPLKPVRTRTPVVLFVDDDPAIIDATTMLLEAEGIEVHTALNGEGALTYVKDGLRPDIIVSDYRLPGYTGVEVIRRVRERTVDDLPAVLMTGDTSAEEIEAANLSNCTVLHKPVNTEQLLALIEQATT